MIAKAVVAVSATLLLWGCGKQESALAPIQRAALKPAPAGQAGSPAEWRADLRAAYRLAPDSRFLLAFGEVERLAHPLPSPAGKAATAAFSGGLWTIQLGDARVGTLPEFPDFADSLALLVHHAKESIHAAPASAPSRAPGAAHDAFLMPGLLKDIESAEKSETKDSFRGASRFFARLTFQMPDPLEIAPLIPARALALLAAARASDGNAGVEEEILLAHALGYTRHAEKLAATLPPDNSLHAFEALDEHALIEMASKPDASEQVRYLAVRRATASGNLAAWTQARETYLPGNDSVAVIATGLAIDLPAQVEVSQRRELMEEALPRAVLRELGRMPSARPPGFEGIDEFQLKLKSAADGTRGSLWDGAAVRACYEAAYYAPLSVERWPPWSIAPTPGMGWRLTELSQPDLLMPPDPHGDTRGAPLVLQRMQKQFQRAQPGYAQMYAELRALVPWLDTRPSDRFALAGFSRYSLQDPRAAEVLFRSLTELVGEKDRKLRADSALYLGDWAMLHGLLGSPEISSPEATAILWSWYTEKVEQERLVAEYERIIARYPNEWNATNQFVDLLRSRKEYGKSCEVVERWLARNPDPQTPGRFHAHVRLATNYILNREPQKALQLLEAMHETEPFQKRVLKREMANALAAVGRLSEAEAMMREASVELSGASDTPRNLTLILWKEGKDDDAVAILANPKTYIQGWEICEALEKDFSSAFLELPSERLTKAIDAIAKEPRLAQYSTCVARGFGNAGRWEDALRIAARLSAPGADPMDSLILQYEFMRGWRGREAAVEWLQGKIPVGKRNPLSIKALYTRNDDVLWDVIGAPNPNDKAEWVWLYRATAFALRGSDGDPHHKELLAYYAKTDQDPPHVMGRYLVGLGTEDDMLALAAASRSRSEIAYYLGVRAQHEKRFGDACEWYRVAAESGESTTPRSLAMWALGGLAEIRQESWKPEPAENAKK